MTFRAGDPDSALSLWYPYLLSAAGTFEIAVDLSSVEFQPGLFDLCSHNLGTLQIMFVFSLSGCKIPGQNSVIRQDEQDKSPQIKKRAADKNE